jgi:hypothetical protein
LRKKLRKKLGKKIGKKNRKEKQIEIGNKKKKHPPDQRAAEWPYKRIGTYK